MSLLNRGHETVTVYPAEDVTDDDGNRRTRVSSVGVVCRAVVQPLGTPTRDDTVGYLSETRYRLRLVGWQGGLLTIPSQVEWQGRRYSVDGEGHIYNSSRRTAHVDYVIVRR